MARSLRVLQPGEQPPAPARRQRPPWLRYVLGSLWVLWAGALVLTLLDEFGSLPHAPLFLALGASLVLAVTYLPFTRGGVRVQDPPATAESEVADDEAAL